MLVVSFNGSVGPKENSDTKNAISALVKDSKDKLYESITDTLKVKITELNMQINETYKDNMDIIGVATEASGEARTLLSKKAADINNEYTEKLEVFRQSLRPSIQSKVDTKPTTVKKVNKKLNKNNGPRRQNSIKENNNVSVLLELAGLLAKHK